MNLKRSGLVLFYFTRCLVRLQLLQPPLRSLTTAVSAFSGRGWRRTPPGRSVWDPRASSAVEGFRFRRLSLDFSPESRVDTKGNKRLSVPVRGLVDIDASWVGLE